MIRTITLGVCAILALLGTVVHSNQVITWSTDSPKPVEMVNILTNAETDLFNRVRNKFPHSDEDVVKTAVQHKAYKDFPTKSDVLALISVESGFRRCPTDGKGSFGPTQVNVKYHNIDPALVCDPEINIHEGKKILRSYFILLGTEKAAIIAYNAGPKNYRNGNYEEDYYHKFVRAKKSLGL